MIPHRGSRPIERSAGGGIVIGVLRTVKLFLTPGWVFVHLFVGAAAIVMVQLGRWQLRVSHAKHFDLQNFGYAFQWWAFSGFAVFFWLRLMRDKVRDDRAPAATGTGLAERAVPVGPTELVSVPEAGRAPITYRGYLMPQSATNPDRHGDHLRASYNDYLWQLALADSAGRSPAGSIAAGSIVDELTPAESVPPEPVGTEIPPARAEIDPSPTDQPG